MVHKIGISRFYEKLIPMCPPRLSGKYAFKISNPKSSSHTARSFRAVGDFHLALRAMVFGALAHSDTSRFAFGIAEAPIGGRAAAAHRHRPAFALEPDHHFAIGAVLAAFLHSDAFGFRPTAPAMGIAKGLALAAIGNGAIVDGRSGGSVSASLRVLNAPALHVPAAAGPAVLVRPCRRATSERRRKADEEESPCSHLSPRSLLPFSIC
jgi:hypothetical protein